MSSQTPNINLTLPTGAEHVSRQIINDNNTKIDTAFGGTAGRELLGYKENGDTASQAISDGSFVVWKGSLYKANGNISQGATLSAVNLTAVSSGGFNDLQGQVDSLSDSLAQLDAGTYDLQLKPGLLKNSAGIYRFFHEWINKNTTKTVEINFINLGSVSIDPSHANIQITNSFLQIYSSNTEFSEDYYYRFNITVTVN